MHEKVTDQKVGVWLDHRKAFFVYIKNGETTTKVLNSEIGPHNKYSHDASYPSGNGPQSGGGEKKYVERNRHELERYYDEVIKGIGLPEAVFIVGPGEAKTELKFRMGLTHGLVERVVSVEPADHLTDAQIVAKVKEHFRVPR